MVVYTLTENNLHIVDSAFVPKKDFNRTLLWIRDCNAQNGKSLVWNRSMCSLINEWATHNFLYMLGIFRSHTKDVDLNYPQKWYEAIGYAILGTIGWLFIK